MLFNIQMHVRWYINVLYIAVGLILGFTINGLYFSAFAVHKPLLEITKSVDIGDILSIIFGFFLAIYIPFSIGKIMDKEKQFKTFAFDNARTILEMLESIHDIIDESYTTDEILTRRKINKIPLLSFRIEDKVRILAKTILNLSNKGKPIQEMIYNSYTAYWDVVTSETFLSDNAKISFELYGKYLDVNSAFEFAIHDAMHKINNM